MTSVGLDVHKVHTQGCFVEAEGQFTELSFATTQEALQRVFSMRARCQILLVSSTESEWVARCLESMGHVVIVADPNYAPMYGDRVRRVKTNRRDARLLARACDSGIYRLAHRLSEEQRQVRATLHVRDTLVRTRSRAISVTRALLRGHGYRVTLGSVESFAERVQRLELPGMLSEQLVPIFALLGLLQEQITLCDRQLARWVRDSELLRRLCTVPAVGTVTAVTYVAILDTAERFTGPHQVEAYLGLVPTEWSSGEKQHRGQLTKCGNRQMRSLLVEAAWRILRSKDPQAQPLRKWAERVQARRGKKIGAVALARKLAGLLYAIWRDGTDYDPARQKGPALVRQA
jgi:transposase